MLGMKFTQINMVSFVPISETRLSEIQRETESDEILQLIKPIILQGWPEDKDKVPASLTPYFHIRDELSVQNGLIFQGERVVVPKSMRSTMIQAVHKSHLGINSCLRRARECLFWPGMSAEIKVEVEKYPACREFEVSQGKETLMSHEIPDCPWAKMDCDLLTLDAKEYMVKTDHFSNFWEIDHLGHNVSAHKVITKLNNLHVLGYLTLLYLITALNLTVTGGGVQSHSIRVFKHLWKLFWC